MFWSQKPFVKLRPVYSVKLVFLHHIRGIQMKITAKFRASRCLRFEDTEELCHPKCAGKVSSPRLFKRSALSFFKGFVLKCPLESSREGRRLGEFLPHPKRNAFLYAETQFWPEFEQNVISSYSAKKWRLVKSVCTLCIVTRCIPSKILHFK